MCAVDEEPDASDVFGYDRVHEVLSAHMWRDLVRVEKPRNAASVAPPAVDDDNDDNDEDIVEEAEKEDKEEEEEEEEEDDVEDEAPVAQGEANDERELRKFEEALKAMAVHQDQTKRKPANVPANGGDDATVVVEEVGANESFDQRKARLANAERMMAMFLDGVGLTMDDI
jgi:hypothetical protein